MAKNFVAELAWRGMIHDIMPDTENVLNEKPASGYIGFDPTSDSLHIGSLVQIMILMHFQRAGHSDCIDWRCDGYDWGPIWKITRAQLAG